ncbi:hypothetical protein ABT173_29510 [Streptomyces sp. NPDC001795]|uniref:hypothetical protein n=1 Tax=unclassified Streptomyces TaxID=2593676 RepID=UPI003325D226
MTILDLHREITARGCRSNYSTIRDWIRRDPPRRICRNPVAGAGAGTTTGL